MEGQGQMDQGRGRSATSTATPVTWRRILSLTYRGLTSQIGLIVILVAFTFMGAGTFMAIEGPHEQREKEDILELRDDIISTVWNTSLAVKQNEASFRLLLQRELRKYESQLYDAYGQGINTDSEDSVWDFWGSFFYCATVYSTIGYGHIAPVTSVGRVVTMIYALLGIPLCLIVMANMGKLFTKGMKFIWAFVRRFYYTGHCSKQGATQQQQQQTEGATETPDGHILYYGYRVDDEFNLPVPLAVGIGFVYILFGAFFYTQWEEWSYLEAFYFIFISVSTIGFGDVLPDHPHYFLLSSFYILIGLSLVAMIITVIMDDMSAKLEQAASRISAGSPSSYDVAAATAASATQPTAQPVSREQKQK